MLLKLCTLFTIPLLAYSSSYNDRYSNEDSFIEMVLSNLTAARNYVLPVNNEKLCYVSPSEEHKIHDYGTFDFIIVGGGSAGSLLANRLTEVEHWNVLLLEAGGPENDFSDIPGMANELYLSDMNWGYYSTPQTTSCLGMAHNQCFSPRGKVLGGSSTLDANVYTRGNKEDYDSWERMGNEGWSYKNVLPYFVKTEHSGMSNCDPGFHGEDGLLDVNYIEPTIFTSIYLKAMEELGFKIVDYNGREQIGVSPIQFTINGNKSASAGRAFIRPFLSRDNLNVNLNAFVTKLLIDKGSKSAYGVEFIKNGKVYTAKASKEIVLSAGAINSPQILMLSGIGPKEELDSLGIDTIVDLPVGKYMQDHPAFILNFRTNRTLFNEPLVTLLKEYLNGHRPFTAGYNVDSIGFVNVNNKDSTLPNIEHVLLVPLGLGGTGRFLNLNEENSKSYVTGSNPYTDIQIWSVLLHPKSKGSVTLKSKSPTDFPNIDYNYFSDPDEEDIETIYKSILDILKLLQTDAFKSVDARYFPTVKVCTKFTEFSKEYWYCMIRHLAVTLHNSVGTTRMGISPRNSVVSPKLMVHDMKGLRIVDAGIMPEIPSGHPNAPTYMIAEKAADEIKRHYGIM